MEQLLLTSFEVQGFRAFTHLEMPRLTRVNLIVGKNNTGKTSLLEALRIYGTKGDPATIAEILGAREEMGYGSFGQDYLAALESSVEQLFSRDRKSADSPRLRIGQVNQGSPVEVTLESVVVTRERGESSLFELETPIVNSLPEPVLVIKSNGGHPVQVPLERLQSVSRRRFELQPSIWVSAYGLSSSEVGEFWDNIALTDYEEHVLEALKIIAPEVQRLSLIGENPPHGNRSVVVKLPGLRRPIPLRSMGDGMNRLLGIALALVNAQNGIVLIDEIENGIHYSVQADLWRLVFRTAARLNVQVFATTHSWDCIDAFQKVANEETESEGILHRLERRKDGAIRVVDLSEEELAIATRNDIEIR